MAHGRGAVSPTACPLDARHPETALKGGQALIFTLITYWVVIVKHTAVLVSDLGCKILKKLEVSEAKTYPRNLSKWSSCLTLSPALCFHRRWGFRLQSGGRRRGRWTGKSFSEWVRF
jgi:hypothetical protein